MLVIPVNINKFNEHTLIGADLQRSASLCRYWRHLQWLLVDTRIFQDKHDPSVEDFDTAILQSIVYMHILHGSPLNILLGVPRDRSRLSGHVYTSVGK